MRLRGVYSKKSERRLPLFQEPAGIDRTEGFFEVHTGGQPVNSESREMSLNGAVQLMFVTCPCRPFCGGRATVPVPANLQFCRTRLPQLLHRQAQRRTFDLGVDYTPYRVSFGRPEVEQAFVVFARDRVPGLAQIERDSAIFEYNGSRRFGQKIRNCTA